MAKDVIQRRSARAQSYAQARVIGNIVRILFASTLALCLFSCSGGDRPRALTGPGSAAKTGPTGPAASTTPAPDAALTRIGKAAGCRTLTKFAPTKPASQGGFCTFSAGITLNLLMFTSTANRNAMLKFNYGQNHVSGYGKNWALFGLYDDLRPTSTWNKAVAADITKATKGAGGKLLK